MTLATPTFKVKCINDHRSVYLRAGWTYTARYPKNMYNVLFIPELDRMYDAERFVRIEEEQEVSLTTIEKPFGELPQATKIALFKAWLDGKALEHKFAGGDKWYYAKFPQWAYNVCYRVERTPETIPKTKDYIDWSHVDKKYKHLRRTVAGAAYLYEHKPTLLSNHASWMYAGDAVKATAFSSYKQGTEDWDEAGIDRPE